MDGPPLESKIKIENESDKPAPSNVLLKQGVPEPKVENEGVMGAATTTRENLNPVQVQEQDPKDEGGDERFFEDSPEVKYKICVLLSWA